MLKTAKDLNAATYNPRTITNSQLKALQKSIENFGDLSTVVYNRKTKTLVAGHQRMKSLEKYPSRIKVKPFKDEYGTVEQGVIEFKTNQGVITVPLRVVSWSLTKEKQANIAANTHGGSFDRQKLATMVAELETEEQLDIELLGINAHDLALLQNIKPEDVQVDTDDEIEEAGEFESVLDRAKATKEKMVCCPGCGLEFQPKAS